MESGLRAGPIPSGVPVAYLAWMSMLLCYRGRFPWWGSFVFLGTKVPWGVSSEEGRAAHGPLHPAMYKSLETFMALLAGVFVLVLVLFFACLFWVIRLSGWFLFGDTALQDSTRVGILFGSLSLFLFGVFAATFFSFFFFFLSLSLSLSLSGAGETQTPSWFGFPLVTLLRAHGLRPLPLIHQGPAPAPVFFVSPSFAWVVVGFFVLGVGSRFGLCFGRFWLLACCPLALLHLVLHLGRLERRDSGRNGAWPSSRCRLDRPGIHVSCWESTLGRSDLRRVGARAPL